MNHPVLRRVSIDIDNKKRALVLQPMAPRASVLAVAFNNCKSVENIF